MLIDDFLNYLRYERNYSNYTIGAYSKDLDQFQRYVREHREGVFNPGEIDSDFVRSWIVSLMDEKLSPVSVNRKLSSLKSFFKFLMKRGIVSANPLRLVNGPKTKKPLPYFIKDSELEALLDGDGFDEDFEGVRNRLVIEMLYDTGMRRSELIGIRNVDVDYEAMQVKVTGKRNKQRLIPFAGAPFFSRFFAAFLRCSSIISSTDFLLRYLLIAICCTHLTIALIAQYRPRPAGSVNPINTENNGII